VKHVTRQNALINLRKFMPILPGAAGIRILLKDSYAGGNQTVLTMILVRKPVGIKTHTGNALTPKPVLGDTTALRQG
jgi:hypothetical protein